MLHRYQIGPFVLVGFLLTMLLLSVLGAYRAVWLHQWTGWLTLLTGLLSIYTFHKRFYRRAD